MPTKSCTGAHRLDQLGVIFNTRSGSFDGPALISVGLNLVHALGHGSDFLGCPICGIHDRIESFGAPLTQTCARVSESFDSRSPTWGGSPMASEPIRPSETWPELERSKRLRTLWVRADPRLFLSKMGLRQDFPVANQGEDCRWGREYQRASRAPKSADDCCGVIWLVPGVPGPWLMATQETLQIAFSLEIVRFRVPRSRSPIESSVRPIRPHPEPTCSSPTLCLARFSNVPQHLGSQNRVDTGLISLPF